MTLNTQIQSALQTRDQIATQLAQQDQILKDLRREYAQQNGLLALPRMETLRHVHT